MIFAARELTEYLKDAGIPFPDECVEAEVLMPADGIMQMRFTINVTMNMLPKIAAALSAYHAAREANEAQRTRKCADCSHGWNYHEEHARYPFKTCNHGACECKGFKEP